MTFVVHSQLVPNANQTQATTLSPSTNPNTNLNPNLNPNEF